MSRHTAVLVALCLLLVSPLGLAAGIPGCTASATGPAFGIYTAFGPATTATGVLTITCTLVGGSGTAQVTAVASYSTGASLTYTNRTLVSGSNLLNYNLYLDPAMKTQIAGDGTAGTFTSTVSFKIIPPVNTAQGQATIYGIIPANQNPAQGSYLDTINVTVSY
jgi:spore coat protein U-like protein